MLAYREGRSSNATVAGQGTNECVNEEATACGSESEEIEVAEEASVVYWNARMASRRNEEREKKAIVEWGRERGGQE